MENNVFYVYIRLKNATWAKLPAMVGKTLTSDYENTMILDLCVCKEPELEQVLIEKANFWKENMANSEASFDSAELVIHQIQISNGGFELSPATIDLIAQTNFSLSMTHTICCLK